MAGAEKETEQEQAAQKEQAAAAQDIEPTAAAQQEHAAPVQEKEVKKQPRDGTQDLNELNVRSAQCASWDVAIYCPWIEEYTNPTSGKPGATLRCMLVSLSDHTSYVAGEVSITNADKKIIEAVTNKLKKRTPVQYVEGDSQNEHQAAVLALPGEARGRLGQDACRPIA